ncbi:unnamed protein product [Effrenium voratum]|uniref:Uncharacterized protein n=1 Tax=Effrenium voratum TaxID=2562239 RepID=A0AA36HYV4_9DINO|nr:unnamed protein product [Effrenium voratum]CAJ1435477.1 unnamed protein product [Effrenium voratum]
MGLLDGYDSDESTAPERNTRRRVVRLDYAKLPVSRRLDPAAREVPARIVEPDAGELEKLAQAKQKEDSESECSGSDSDDTSRPEPASNCEAPVGALPFLLPAPKAEGQAASIEIDFKALGKPREKPQAASQVNAWLIKRPFAPTVEEEEEEQFPESLLKHPMLRSRAGPTQSEVAELQSRKKVVHIRADSMKDPDWQLNSLLVGQPGHLRGHAVPTAVSQFETEEWNQSTLSYPSRSQKRKSQINWLAQEAINKEAEHLDRVAHGKQCKAQTWHKYGW